MNIFGNLHRYLLAMAIIFAIPFFILTVMGLLVQGVSNLGMIAYIGSLVGIIFCVIASAFIGIISSLRFLITKLEQNRYHRERPMVKHDDYRLKNEDYHVSRYAKKCRMCGKHPMSRQYHIKHVHNIDNVENSLIFEINDESRGICFLYDQPKYASLLSKYFENCGCENCVYIYYVKGFSE